MSARAITLVLGTAGAFLAAGLTSMATPPVAHADDGTDLAAALSAADLAAFFPAAAEPAATVLPDGFTFTTDPLLAMFGVTEIGAFNAGQDFEAMILQIPSLGITDVLTSGNEATNDLAQFGVSNAVGLGVDGVTVNTFTDSMMPSLDSLYSFTIPFEDPLASLWDFLVVNDFFGL
jgi:hypothetical protein